MFAYLRYFSAISFFVVVVAALFVGRYFRDTAEDDLKYIVHNNNVSLAQGFINTTWREHRRSFEKLAKIDVARWQKYKQFVHFSEDAFRYFEAIPVAKLNIYTKKGERFLSTDQSEIVFFASGGGGPGLTSLTNEDGGKSGFALAQEGKITSTIIPESGFRTPDGRTKKGTLVQTFVPIISDSYVPIVADSSPKVEAIIEVFYDITDQWEQLSKFQYIAVIGILVIFVVLFAALYFTSQKAEMIIAKQHEKNLELTAAAARAEAANREKSKFLANISHELRTPLNAIIGFSEIIKNEVMGPLGNQQYVDYIKDIHSSGSHLLSLINDILDYSKAEAGKLELEIADVDATKILKTSMRLVSPRAEAAGVNLVQEIPKEHFVLKTDAKKLKQIMLNLLSNAVKFTPANGEVKVSAWQNVQDESLTIEVKDSGIGIAPKDISKALAPFGQVDSELSRKYEGTGLGLPLTKKFVEIMGGRFDIQSELNAGTTITFTLPKEAPEKYWKKGSNAQKQEEEATEETSENNEDTLPENSDAMALSMDVSSPGLPESEPSTEKEPDLMQVQPEQTTSAPAPIPEMMEPESSTGPEEMTASETPLPESPAPAEPSAEAGALAFELETPAPSAEPPATPEESQSSGLQEPAPSAPPSSAPIFRPDTPDSPPEPEIPPETPPETPPQPEPQPTPPSEIPPGEPSPSPLPTQPPYEGSSGGFTDAAPASPFQQQEGNAGEEESDIPAGPVGPAPFASPPAMETPPSPESSSSESAPPAFRPDSPSEIPASDGTVSSTPAFELATPDLPASPESSNGNGNGHASPTEPPLTAEENKDEEDTASGASGNDQNPPHFRPGGGFQIP